LGIIVRLLLFLYFCCHYTFQNDLQPQLNSQLCQSQSIFPTIRYTRIKTMLKSDFRFKQFTLKLNNKIEIVLRKIALEFYIGGYQPAQK
jgi:hypothetical protein